MGMALAPLLLLLLSLVRRASEQRPDQLIDDSRAEQLTGELRMAIIVSLLWADHNNGKSHTRLIFSRAKVTFHGFFFFFVLSGFFFVLFCNSSLYYYAIVVNGKATLAAGLLVFVYLLFSTPTFPGQCHYYRIVSDGSFCFGWFFYNSSS